MFGVFGLGAKLISLLGRTGRLMLDAHERSGGWQVSRKMSKAKGAPGAAVQSCVSRRFIFLMN